MKGKEINNVVKIHMYVFLSSLEVKSFGYKSYDTHMSSNTKTVHMYKHIFLSRTKERSSDFCFIWLYTRVQQNIIFFHHHV